jgi:cell division protein ZipA
MQNYYAILGLILLVVAAFYVGQGYRQYRRRLRLKIEPIPGGDVEVRSLEAVSKVRVVPRTGQTSPAMPVLRPTPSLGPAVVRERPVVAEPTDIADVQPLVDEPLVVQPAQEFDPVLPAYEPFSPFLGDEPDVSEPVVVAPVLEAEPAPEQPALLPELEEPVVEEEVVAPEPMPVLEGPVSSKPRLVAVPAIQQHDLFADEALPPPPSTLRRRSSAPRASALYDMPDLEPVNTLGNSANQQKMPGEDVQDVIAVHVICRGTPFKGEDLLRCILSYGLRFGEMNIFHRHEMPSGQGKVLFSMAKAVEPGTFDIEGMTSEEIPGVSFFQALPGLHSIQAYEIMIDTAKRLAFELGGEILDLQQSPLTRQLVEHYRERVVEFERRRLMARKVK